MCSKTTPSKAHYREAKTSSVPKRLLVPDIPRTVGATPTRAPLFSPSTRAPEVVTTAQNTARAAALVQRRRP